MFRDESFAGARICNSGIRGQPQVVYIRVTLVANKARKRTRAQAFSASRICVG